jgi:hypothetical protein
VHASPRRAELPDPNSNGGFQGLPAASSQVTAADHGCHHLLNADPQMSQAQQQHALGQLVKYARCMRAHGVPNFPDPQTTNGGIGEPSGIGFGGDIARNAPQFQSADHACQHLANSAKG